MSDKLMIVGSVGINRVDGRSCTDDDLDLVVKGVIAFCELNGYEIGSTWKLENEEQEE